MSSSNGARTGNRHAPTPALEDEIARVAGVHGARVVFDDTGDISEVHVLASGTRSAKQIMRDVTSTIQVGFGVALDYRKVSIARLDAESLPTRPAVAKQQTGGARPAVDVVVATSRANKTEVTVTLNHHGRIYDGAARGPAKSALKLAADATVDAGGDLLDDLAVEVRSAEVVKTSDGELVGLVVLRALAERREETWSGSAVVRKDPSDAIVRATLAAMNRALLSKQNEGRN